MNPGILFPAVESMYNMIKAFFIKMIIFSNRRDIRHEL